MPFLFVDSQTPMNKTPSLLPRSKKCAWLLTPASEQNKPTKGNTALLTHLQSEEPRAASA